MIDKIYRSGSSLAGHCHASSVSWDFMYLSKPNMWPIYWFFKIFLAFLSILIEVFTCNLEIGKFCWVLFWSIKPIAKHIFFIFSQLRSARFGISIYRYVCNFQRTPEALGFRVYMNICKGRLMNATKVSFSFCDHGFILIWRFQGWTYTLM